MGEIWKKQYTLIDSRANINSLIYESLVDIGKATLIPSQTTIALFIGDSNIVQRYFELSILIKNDNSNVQHIFYVMKLGKVITPVTTMVKDLQWNIKLTKRWH